MTDDGGVEPSRWWPQAERLADAAYPQQIESALKSAFAQGQVDARKERDALKSAPQRVATWSEEAFREFDLGDGTVEEATEIAQACGVPSDVLHRLFEYLCNCTTDDGALVLGKCLLALYSLGFDADEALEAELLRVQQPEGTEKARRLFHDLHTENAETYRENRRLIDIANSTDDLLTKYDYMLEIWPANTLCIYVRRLTESHAHRIITTRPPSAVALFDALKGIHGNREEAEYEIEIVDTTSSELRGTGRIVMPDAQSAPELTR